MCLLQKVYLRFPGEMDFSLFAWKQAKGLSPVINVGSGLKHKKIIFNTSALGAHEKWEKWPKCQCWDIFTHGTPNSI